MFAQGDISAKIVCDSWSMGVRLTTFECEVPKVFLQDLNTHRMLSRNAASSAAIPTKTIIENIRNGNYYHPPKWFRNTPGMQTVEEITDEYELDSLDDSWGRMVDRACEDAEFLASLGLHKRYANRVLEPYMMVKWLVTATDWDNFLNLRQHGGAQYELQVLAGKIRDLLNTHEPQATKYHVPYLRGWEELDVQTRPITDDEFRQFALISAARCARVSYNKTEAQDRRDEINRAQKLLDSGHMSPFEHIAKVDATWKSRSPYGYCGNFRLPWVQFRKTIKGESVWEPTT